MMRSATSTERRSASAPSVATWRSYSVRSLPGSARVEAARTAPGGARVAVRPLLRGGFSTRSIKAVHAMNRVGAGEWERPLDAMAVNAEPAPPQPHRDGRGG